MTNDESIRESRRTDNEKRAVKLLEALFFVIRHSSFVIPISSFLPQYFPAFK
jgi:hypothetical protein